MESIPKVNVRSTADSVRVSTHPIASNHPWLRWNLEVVDSYDVYVHLHVFLQFLQRETTAMTFCLLPWTKRLFRKEFY